MKSRTLILFSVCLFIITGSFKAQNLNFVPPPFVYYAFDKDSLQGFDETAARLNAIQEQFRFRIKSAHVSAKTPIYKR